MIYYINNSIKNDKYPSLNLIEKYPYKWDYYNLSKNPNLTEKFILKYPYQNWDIKYLINNNKIIDFKALNKFKYLNGFIIKKYLNKLWDWEWLIENTNIYIENCIPFNLIEKYSHKWDYYFLSKNLKLTEEFILKYPNKYWDIGYLIDNNKITNFKALTKFKYIDEDIINNYSDKPWDWEWLNEHIYNVKQFKEYRFLNQDLSITEEFILKYPYKKWDIIKLINNNKITNFKVLSKFKNINQYIIDNYPNKPWDWEWLIENTNICVEEYIPLNLIKKYLYKWNYYFLSKNSNLTEEFILKYPYQNWDIEYLIENNKIIDFNSLSKFKYIYDYIINNYKNKPWDWEWLIENTSINIEKYISLKLIKKYPYKWDYQILSKNPNLTEDFILKYSYKNWNIEYLSKNIFKKFFYKLIIK